MTFLVKSAFLQKQVKSLLSLQPDSLIQVFKHWGRTAGQSLFGGGGGGVPGRELVWGELGVEDEAGGGGGAELLGGGPEQLPSGPFP